MKHKLPQHLRRPACYSVDGTCQHVNRVCQDTRNTEGELFIKRRKYHCDDCGKIVNTVELEIDIPRYSAEAAREAIFNRVAPHVEDYTRYMRMLRRSLKELNRIFNRE